MKAWEFEAVVYESLVYCTACLPGGIEVDSEDVSPIFATDEVDAYPVCDACGGEHDYMRLTTEGQASLNRE